MLNHRAAFLTRKEATAMMKTYNQASSRARHANGRKHAPAKAPAPARVKAGDCDASPAQPACTRPAAPSPEYLTARARLESSGEKHLSPRLTLNMPGLTFGCAVTVQELLESVLMPLFWESERIMRECVSRAASTWEAVELAEALAIADALENRKVDPGEDGLWRIPEQGFIFTSFRKSHSADELLRHVCFVVYWHAESIARHSLDALERESLMEASALAGALVISERVMMTLGVVPEGGAAAQPTRWQQRACELKTRYFTSGEWQSESGREDFCDRERIEQRLGIAPTTTDKVNAAAA